MRDAADIAHVGSGPAGAALAIRLCARGVRPLLLDKAAFPRPKPCGEGVLPAGVAVLWELGVLERLRAAGAVPLEALVFHAGGVSLRVPFRSPGLGLPREVLDAALQDKALEAGACRRQGEVVAIERKQGGFALVLDDGTRLQAATIAAADGARSRLRGWAGIAAVSRGRRAGACRAFETRGHPGGDVHVVVTGTGQLFLGPTGPRRVQVTLLFDGPGAHERFEAAVEEARGIPGPRRILDGMRPLGPLRGAGGFGTESDSPASDGVLLAGDAALSLDPIGGDGVSLALAGSRPASAAILAGLGARARRDYRSALKELSARRRAFAGVLLAAAQRPAAAAAVLRAMSRLPRAAETLAALHEV